LRDWGFQYLNDPIEDLQWREYIELPHMSLTRGTQELKKGSAELLILSLVEDRARHGYEIAQLIERRSEGALKFYAASLYPLLYRLEKLGWLEGRWVERANARRRRMYRLTAEGRKILAAQRSGWRAFVRAINRITGVEHA
jgi:PadR family transcriptional regulator, regulatory protein PadR